MAQPPDAAALAAWLPGIQVRGGELTGGACIALRRHKPQLLQRFLLPACLLPACLQAEVEAHGDVVMLRGADTYTNLPNKTLRLLRYVAAHPAGALLCLVGGRPCPHRS